MGDQPRSLVRNAADQKQVEFARRKERAREEQLADAYRDVLRTPAGRRVLWDILERCKLFETITVQSSIIYTLSGRRDVGLELMAQLAQEDEEMLDLMQREARQRAKREVADSDAARVARASREDNDA